MALKHRAFTFNINEFYNDLQNVIVESKLSKERLWELSKEAVGKPSVATIQALNFLRYDQEWFDLSDPDISRESDWYLVFLTSKFKMAPDLSSSQPFSYSILRRVLKLVGWSSDHIDLLIKGSDLETLVKVTNDPIFISSFTFPQYRGGWVNQEDISMLYSKLTLSQEVFFEPSKQLIESVEDLAGYFSLGPDEVIRKSYVEAVCMLSYALQRKNPLFFILD